MFCDKLSTIAQSPSRVDSSRDDGVQSKLAEPGVQHTENTQEDPLADVGQAEKILSRRKNKKKPSEVSQPEVNYTRKHSSANVSQTKRLFSRFKNKNKSSKAYRLWRSGMKWKNWLEKRKSANDAKNSK